MKIPHDSLNTPQVDKLLTKELVKMLPDNITCQAAGSDLVTHPMDGPKVEDNTRNYDRLKKIQNGVSTVVSNISNQKKNNSPLSQIASKVSKWKASITHKEPKTLQQRGEKYAASLAAKTPPSELELRLRKKTQ